MTDVLAEIPVDAAIKNALLGRETRYWPIFEVLLDYESGTWEQLLHSSRHIGLRENFLPGLYLCSVQWVSQVLSSSPILVRPL
jgi:EAL and modified HD-GYP domain-containing signal transduction protein